MNVKNNQKFESKELLELKQLISHFNNNLANLKSRLAIWKSMNDFTLENAIYKHKTEYAFFTIKNSLLLSCFIDIANLGNDNDSRSLSLVRIMSFLDQEKIKNELRNIRKNTRVQIDFGIKGSPKVIVNILYEMQTKRRTEFFEDSLKKLNEKYTEPTFKAKLKLFWDVRRKSAAHIDLSNKDGELKFFDISKLGLTWDDLDLIVKNFEEINYFLFAVVEAAEVDFQSFDNDLSMQIGKFWEPFLKFPLAEPSA